jgi:hypothetical protein
MSDALLDSLRAAVEASPDDIPLRMHLAELLASLGMRDEAVRQAAAVLQRDSGNVSALRLIGAGPADAPPREDDSAAETLRRLDQELDGLVPPMYVSSEAGPDDASLGEAYDPEPAVGLRLADVGGWRR